MKHIIKTDELDVRVSKDIVKLLMRTWAEKQVKEYLEDYEFVGVSLPFRNDYTLTTSDGNVSFTRRIK